MDSRDDDKQQAGFGSPRDDQNLLLEGLERKVQELERQRVQFQTMLFSIGDGFSISCGMEKASSITRACA